MLNYQRVPLATPEKLTDVELDVSLSCCRRRGGAELAVQLEGHQLVTCHDPSPLYESTNQWEFGTM